MACRIWDPLLFVTLLVVMHSLISFWSYTPQKNTLQLHCGQAVARTQEYGMGLKFLHRKRKTGRDLCFSSPCLGPAQQHKHVFVLLFSAAITQQPGKPLAHQRRLRTVTKYPRAGCAPGLFLEWCDQGMHHCSMIWLFPKSSGSFGHTGMEGEPCNSLTQQPSHAARRFFFPQIYPLYLFI